MTAVVEPITDPTVEEMVTRIAREARSVISRAGWVQNDLVNPRGVCLLGGVMLAMSALDVKISDDAFFHFMTRLRAVIDCRGIPDWNDVPGRTQAEVLAALDQVEKGED